MSSTVLTPESSCSHKQLSEADLHPYQKRAVDFVLGKSKCALWIDMGLGKTAISLTAIAHLFNRFEIGRVLIIATVRVIKNTWPAEFDLWAQSSDLTWAIIHGKKDKRLKALAGEEDIHMINREMVTWLVNHYKAKWPYDTVIIDEASAFRSPTSQRFKSLKKVLPKIDRLIELTATPTSKGLVDIWPQIFLLDQGQRLRKTFSMFCEEYCISDYTGYNWLLREGSKELIHDQLQGICLTLSAKDYLSLPDRINNFIYLDLTRQETAQYRELEKEFLLELDQNTVKAINAGVLSGKLRQFCQGALYTDKQGRWDSVHQHKLDALEELVEAANGQSVLVAYSFQFDKERITQRFKEAVSIDEAHAIERWNAGEIPILIAHPASAGHGLNLQKGGHIIVWYGLSYFELYTQFNGRLHRQGQTRPVTVHHILINNTVDITSMESLQKGQATHQDLINALKTDIKHRQAQYGKG